MRRFRTVRTVAAVSLLSISCIAVSAGAAQRDRDNIIAELRLIQSQLNDMVNANAALVQAIEELKSQSQSQQDGLRKTLADSNVALERLQQDLSIISSRVDETNGRMGNLQQEVASMRHNQQPLLIPPLETDGDGEQTAEDGDDGEVPPPVMAAVPNVTDIYNQARIDYTQGRYGLAISGFEDVLGSDPRGDLADNAHYWIGESYLAQRQYERAIETFDRVIRDYPDSNKRSDAYLKKGMALQDLDRRSEALLIYELVIEQFPNSQHGRIARTRIEELMRTTPPRF